MVRYIAKANNDVISDCKCADALAAGPAQLDCPWCSCGWLLTCIKCRKDFTFGRVVDVDRSYASIVREDFTNRGEAASEDEVTDGAEWMAEALADLKIGDTVVYLDGSYLPLDTTNFAYDGWHAQHDFDRLPHAVALEHPNALRETLGVKSYWDERELVDDAEDDGEDDE